RPHLFAATPGFLARSQVRAMQAVIDAIETVTALPAYRDRVPAHAPAIARPDPGTRSGFLGYDLHLTPSGPTPIEINTNAGGAALPAYRDRVLAHAPAIAPHDAGTRSVFLGYGFHLTPSGPKLIEINTNAGGAMLNAALLQAAKACCVEVETLPPASGLAEGL